MSRPTTRRQFMHASAAVAAGFWLSPRPARARYRSANEQLDIAKIGCGGQGADDLQHISGENIVALCDVDEARAAKTYRDYHQTPKFPDYRRLFDRMAKEFDAVVISTPDHMHAPIALAAMQLGKHVYCQKPLTHTVFEARRMSEAAAKYRVITQMGNQGHSYDGARTSVEILRAGVISDVTEVYCWTDRPSGWWPQGIDRPTESQPVPSTLHWDEWLGVAPERPYHEVYLPFKWRGWWDFGTGSMGDMACHVADVACWALELRNPSAITCATAPRHEETGPIWAKITWEFPARGKLPPVKLHWWDGRKKPPRMLFEGQRIGDNGALFIGTKGKLYCDDTFCSKQQLLPERDFAGFQPPAPSLPRVPDQHHFGAWIQACKDGRATKDVLSDFAYAAPMVEMLLLGNLAVRTGERIEWDAEARKVTNLPDANQYLDMPYRKGW